MQGCEISNCGGARGSEMMQGQPNKKKKTRRECKIVKKGGARSKTKIRPNKQRRRMDLECE